MLNKQSEPDDPFEIVGVELPGQSEAQLRDMALCFAEEFVRDGWEEEKILRMFHNPQYHGPYMVFQQKGDDFIRPVIKEAINMWRPTRRG